MKDERRKRDGRYGHKATFPKEGKGGGRGGRREGGRRLCCTSFSSLCPDTFEVLEEEKSRPPVTLTSCLHPPISMPLFLGHLWLEEWAVVAEEQPVH